MMKNKRKHLDIEGFNTEMTRCVELRTVTEAMGGMLLQLIFNIATSQRVTRKVLSAAEREEMMLTVIEKTYKNLKKKLHKGYIDPSKNSYSYVSLIVQGKFKDEIRRMRYCDWLGQRIRIDEDDGHGGTRLGKATIVYFEDL